jgi:16S rRNA C967 or C1407 C5-methylase (RsmB/RsmF family)
MLVSRLARDHNVTLTPMLTNETTTSTVEGEEEPNPAASLPATPQRLPSIWSMPAWKDGWFEVQDAGSQFIVASTDFCAGNGGKTLAMLS